MNIKYFEKNTAGRDFVVGDIHGHFSTLQRQLDEIGFDPEVDRLFSVGDLVDRGPESEDVLFWLDTSWFHAVRGNHEVMTYERADYHIANGGMWYYGLTETEQELIAFELAQLPLAIEVDTDDGRVGIIHAQVPLLDWDILKTTDNSIIEAEAVWGRSIMAKYKHTGDAGNTWVKNIDKVYVGHTIVKHPIVIGNIHYIDTSAYKGAGRLTIERIQ